MDPEYSLLQDVVRCGLCETLVPTMYCDICKLNLCKPCVGEHLSDESTEHKVVPFKKRGSTLYCTEHSKKLCDLHCDQCDIPICVQCVSSGEHHGHKQGDIIKFLQNKNEALQRDLKELESTIYPRYPDMNYSMEGQRVESFQRRELNVTRMRRSKHDRVQRKGQSKKKPEMQSLQYNHEVRPRRSYVQDPPLSESYPDPTTRTGAVYVNSFPKKAFGRSRRKFRKDNRQHFECPMCNQTFLDMETFQIHVLDSFDKGIPCTTLIYT